MTSEDFRIYVEGLFGYFLHVEMFHIQTIEFFSFSRFVLPWEIMKEKEKEEEEDDDDDKRKSCTTVMK